MRKLTLKITCLALLGIVILGLGIENRIEVYAVDEAGNRSAPATMTST